MTILHRAVLWALAPLAGSLLLAGCGDNPVGPAGDDDHVAAFGLILRLETDTLYSYSATDGTVGCSSVPCEIVVRAGALTPAIDVIFTDADSAQIDITDLAGEFDLHYVVADTTVASALVDERDSISLRVGGRTPGETRMRLSLLHGGEHEDFGSPPLDDVRAILIRVTE